MDTDQNQIVDDEKPMAGEMTLADYARHRNIHISSLRARISGGKLDGAWRRLKSGRIRVNVELADRLWIANGDPNQIRKMKANMATLGADDLKRTLGEVADYNASKAKEKKHQADIAEMNALKLKGELVERKAVQQKLFEMARKIRANLEAIPAKVMDILAAETTPYGVEKILSEEIRKTLEDLADDIID